jgi:hypothetical protein
MIDRALDNLSLLCHEEAYSLVCPCKLTTIEISHEPAGEANHLI